MTEPMNASKFAGVSDTNSTTKAPDIKPEVVKIDESKVDRCFPYPTYYKYQREAIIEIIEAFMSGSRVVIVDAPTGCHAKGQGILTYDGHIKNVEDIEVDDLLMGLDSNPRHVLRLCRGYQDMAEIVPVKGNPFTVNLDHILTLVRTNEENKKDRERIKAWRGQNRTDKPGDLIDISVREWLTWPKWKKHIHKLIRTGVDFPVGLELPLEPYLVGALLGDGSLNKGCVVIHSQEYPILEYFLLIAKSVGGHLSGYRRKDKLREIGLAGMRCETKRIPHIYCISSYQSRLQLLAGLMDTDGSLQKKGFDYISKSEGLSNDIAFVARSVGLAAYVTECPKGCQTDAVGTYWKVSISGNCSIIPCKLTRKRCEVRLQKKNVLRTGFKINLLPKADFYGFILDGDGRYLLDDFTITHNSGKTPIADTVMKYFGGEAWGCTPKNMLVDQYKELGWATVKGAGNYSCTKYENRSCAEGTTMARALGEIDKHEQGCNPDCPYRKTVKKFFSNNHGGMTNTHFMWFNLSKFLKHSKDLLVVDEAHLLESALADMITVRITKEDLLAIKYDQVLDSIEDREPWITGYIEAAVSEVEAQKTILKSIRVPKVKKIKRKLMETREDKELRLQKDKEEKEIRAKKVKEFKETISKIDFIQRRLKSVEGYNQYQNSTRWIAKYEHDGFGHVIKLSLEPVYGGFLAEELFAISSKTLLMSATFLDKESTCSELKLDPKDVAYIQIPNWFPIENQPLFWDNSYKLNFSNMEDIVPFLVQKIDRIIDHQDNIGKPRGIIHTVSYRLTDLICRYSRHAERFSKTGNGEFLAHAIRKHMNRKDSILIGPAFVEGLDLKGDLGEFCIIPKIPFPPIAHDPKLKIRVIDNPNYADLLTVRTLVQAKGRVIRSAEEQANTYCLDGNLNILFRKVNRFFPQHYRDSIVTTNL